MRDDEIAALYRRERSRKRVALASGLSEWQVRQALQRAGQPSFPPGPPEAARLRGLDWPALYREHGSLRAVARAAGCSKSAAQDHLIAAGVETATGWRDWTFAEAVKLRDAAERYGSGEAARMAGIPVKELFRLRKQLQGGPWRPRPRRKPRLPGCVSWATVKRRERARLLGRNGR